MFDLIGETASIVRIAALTNDMMFGATALIHTPQLICATFGTFRTDFVASDLLFIHEGDEFPRFHSVIQARAVA